MTRRNAPRSTGGFLIGLVFILAACAGLVLSFNLALDFPAQAASIYGPPASGLGLWQKIRLSYFLVMDKSQLTSPVDPAAASVKFTIESGESTDSILARLETAGLIPDAASFRAYLIYKGIDTHLQAGDYELSARLSPVEIAGRIQDATRAEIAFGVLPGWRLEEIALSLPSSGLAITPEEFIAAANSRPGQAAITAELPYGVSLEGFLFPGLYSVPRAAGASELVLILLHGFEGQVTTSLRSQLEAQGLSLHEAVILASIVEREAVLNDEKPMIASVFLNRLRMGMKLDADPTVQYAVGFNPGLNTWWSNPLTFEHLQTDSPYNTYLYAGLPPSPIANPDLASLQAVASPASTDFLYFRAACDGSGAHVFSYTLEEHNARSCP
ncbi:MAG: endolytic transglycosylase MltG [Chloroflexi bacterium]|nr:endolytic transglycosylase MltG [Chloroflexota bacterium]